MANLKLIEPVTEEEVEDLDFLEKTLSRAIIFPGDDTHSAFTEYYEYVYCSSKLLQQFDDRSFDVVTKLIEQLLSMVPAGDREAAEKMVNGDLQGALYQYGASQGMIYAAMVRTMQDPFFIQRLQPLSEDRPEER